MAKKPSQPGTARSRLLRRTLGGVVILVLAYMLFGFLAVPAIVKSQAEARIADKLQRQAAIGEVSFNPFTLVLGMRDFRLFEADGKTVFASLDTLQLDLAAESLLRLAPVVQQLSLGGPQLRLVRRDAHSYNFDDILERLAAEPASEERARFSINNITLEGGRIDFDDHPAKAKQVVSDIRLGIPFISSLPSQVDIFVQPLLSARVNNTPLLIKGRARPFAETREAVVEFNADDLDLTRYLGYLPSRWRLRVPGGRLDLHMTASFRQQPDQAPGLLLDGDLKLKSLQVMEADGRPVLKLGELGLALRKTDVFADRIELARIAVSGLQADVARGEDGIWNVARLFPSEPAAAPAKPTPAPSAAPPGLLLRELSLRDATLRYADAVAGQRLTVDGFGMSVRGLALDAGKRSIRIDEIASDKADLLLLRQAAQEKPSAQAPAPGAGDKEAGYSVAVDMLRVAGWSLRVEDGGGAERLAATVKPISLTVRGFSTAGGVPLQVDLNAGVGQGGRLAAQGSVVLEPLQADLKLDLKEVDLLPLQPYIGQRVNLRLVRGNLSGGGRLQLATDQQGLRGGFKGDAGLGNLSMVEKAENTEFLRWKSLSLSGIDLRLQPLALNVDDVALNDFFARVIIDPDGRINLQEVVAHPPAQSGQAAQPARPTQPAATKQAAGQKPGADTLPVAVRKLTLQGGRVRFTDNFIKPNYSATLSAFGGTVSGLSSDPNSSAAVDLRGEVNNAPLSVAGRINPLRGDLFLDLKANVRGMELAPLSPYSGRYVGYRIEKGKLSFEVAYRVEQRKLSAQNRLILDQLELGEKINSPSALDLPVQFAVSLLRDSNGVIDVNLPVAGSFDDPQFSIGGLLFRVLGNVIAKAVTQPFAMLGSLFGGRGEEMSVLEFEPGRAALRPDAETKLGSLAKALADRPALKLEVAGRADPQADLDGLKHAVVDRKVRSLKARDVSTRSDTVRPGSVTVSAQEYPELLRRVYRNESFDKPRNLLGLPKDLPVAEMEKLIAEHAQPDEDDLNNLANQRAAAARNWLVKNGQVPVERIFLLAPRVGGVDDKQGGSRVELSLR